MMSIIWLVDAIFSLVWWIILASVVSSWLIHFGIINMQNQTVRQIIYGLHRVTEPLLAPVRRIIPSFGGLDFSPIILLIALEFLRRFIIEALFTLAK